MSYVELIYFTGTICMRIYFVAAEIKENYSNWMPQCCKTLALRQIIKREVSLSLY